jgi:DNA-directed RNA polymerase subunit RPC12/RpoP
MDLAKAVQTLLEQGEEVPQALQDLATIQDREKRGVEQVYKCSKCNTTYESKIVLTEAASIFCGCGRLMDKVWP